MHRRSTVQLPNTMTAGLVRITLTIGGNGMTTRHLVVPELLAALELMPSRPTTAENLAEVRAQRAAMIAAQPPPTVTDVDVSERFIPGPPGAPDVRALVYTP